MDELDSAWPFWKFGLQKDDLKTTLHDRFNTVKSAIQDPEAFHHDVYEISTRASTLDEFEQLMEQRKKLRLEELNGMLEDASFEIIGNPSLIGTEQWQYAAQLFRTRSLDSLVRYFSSYLPQEHPWHHDSVSSISSTEITHPSIFDCDDPMLFDEPEEDDAYYHNEQCQPLDTADVALDQPARSMTVRSEDSGVSVTDCDRQKKHDDVHTPQRALSFSESEPEHVTASSHDSIPTIHDDEEGTTQPDDDPESPSTSISDLSDVDESHGKGLLVVTIVHGDAHEEYLSISHDQITSVDSTKTQTSTPKPEFIRSAAAPLIDTTLSSLRRRSPSCSRLLSHHAHSNHQNSRSQLSTSRQVRMRGSSLDRQRPRYEPRGRSSRVQKSTPEVHGLRQRGRKNVFL